MSAFLSYSQSMRPLIRLQNPLLKTLDISSVLSKKWKIASNEEKQPHIERELKDRAIYHTEMSRWKEEEESNRINKSNKNIFQLNNNSHTNSISKSETDLNEEIDYNICYDEIASQINQIHYHNERTTQQHQYEHTNHHTPHEDQLEVNPIRNRSSQLNEQINQILVINNESKKRHYNELQYQLTDEDNQNYLSNPFITTMNNIETHNNLKKFDGPLLRTIGYACESQQSNYTINNNSNQNKMINSQTIQQNNSIENKISNDLSNNSQNLLTNVVTNNPKLSNNNIGSNYNVALRLLNIIDESNMSSYNPLTIYHQQQQQQQQQQQEKHKQSQHIFQQPLKREPRPQNK